MKSYDISKPEKEYRLKKDILIPAGSIFKRAPEKVVRYGDGHIDATIEYNANSIGMISAYIGDPDMGEWFEEVDSEG
jgi:hypothetical protein